MLSCTAVRVLDDAFIFLAMRKMTWINFPKNHLK